MMATITIEKNGWWGVIGFVAPWVAFSFACWAYFWHRIFKGPWR